MPAALLPDGLDALVLAEVLAPEVLDLEPGLCGDRLRVVADLPAQRIGEVLHVETSQALVGQACRHGPGVRDLHQRACDDHTIKAAQRAFNLRRIALQQSGSRT